MGAATYKRERLDVRPRRRCAELGSEPSAREAVLIETAAAALRDGCKLRTKGLPSTEADRLFVRAMATPFAPMRACGRRHKTPAHEREASVTVRELEQKITHQQRNRAERAR
jgi:hypothetical protein